MSEQYRCIHCGGIVGRTTKYAVKVHMDEDGKRCTASGTWVPKPGVTYRYCPISLVHPLEWENEEWNN